MLFSGAALVWPPAFTWFGGDAIQWGLGFIMLGMGLTLELGNFERVVRRPWPIAVGMQNAGLFTTLAQKYFVDLALAPVPCALSAIASCLIGSLAAAFWRGAPESSPSEAALT